MSMPARPSTCRPPWSSTCRGDGRAGHLEALQIHGGAGYTTDFPIERYWRDARLTKIFEGTSEIMQRLISDRLLPPTPFR